MQQLPIIEKPGVCVLVRTRERLTLLTRALASISAQTQLPEQVVVINDGGDSGMAERAISEIAIPSSITVVILHNLTSVGRGGALNQGLAAARSKWVAILDDDDTWAPEFLHHAMACSGLQTGVVQGVVVLTTEILEEVDKAGAVRELLRYPMSGQDMQDITVRDLAGMNVFTINAFVFSREAALALGGFRVDLPVLEDWEFNLRYCAKHPVGLLREHLAYYHKRPCAAGAAANTDLDLHATVRHRLQGEWLRADLASGRMGLGYLCMMADLHRELDVFFRLKRRVLRWLRWIGVRR